MKTTRIFILYQKIPVKNYYCDHYLGLHFGFRTIADALEGCFWVNSQKQNITSKFLEGKLILRCLFKINV